MMDSMKDGAASTATSSAASVLYPGEGAAVAPILNSSETADERVVRFSATYAGMQSYKRDLRRSQYRCASQTCCTSTYMLHTHTHVAHTRAGDDIACAAASGNANMAVSPSCCCPLHPALPRWLCSHGLPGCGHQCCRRWQQNTHLRLGCSWHCIRYAPAHLWRRWRVPYWYPIPSVSKRMRLPQDARLCACCF
jgi:hypothetical protein